ncbi:MAG: DASH family cryptochrome [Bacteroidetes bacterium]|nr:MAG: DASH family cryptochrome [Bacteroidota bacterium]
MKSQCAIVLFRNDLRLHDHEALCRAHEGAETVLHVYCIDPRMFAKTSLGFEKTGYFRARFLMESLQALRSALRACGSELLVQHGKPEEVIPELVRTYGASKVFAHKEVAQEEVQVEAALETALLRQGVPLKLYWGATLFHIEDLPMPVHALPDIFTHFRKQVEKSTEVRAQFSIPSRLTSPPVPDPGVIPATCELGLEAKEEDIRAVWPFKGGEKAALERLQDYFWQKDCLRIYKDTRDGLLGADYSSKLSPWLALGCISPRYIYDQVQQYERERKKNESTYWLIFELIWRDYFRFVAKKYGSAIFHKGGIRQTENNGTQNWSLFDTWREGKTGYAFVDANMRELAATGYMSNRGRQNVASFLVRDLGLDWRMGAEYFESLLLDYDVCSNWGNWNYVAGVGNDPRENRYFNVVSQGKRYDPRGEYVRTWLSEEDMRQKI